MGTYQRLCVIPLSAQVSGGTDSHSEHDNHTHTRTTVVHTRLQELGRFPDLGSFDMESVPAYGGTEQVPSSSERQADGSRHSGTSSRQADMTPFVTQPKKASNTVAGEIVEEADVPIEEDAEAAAAQQQAAEDGEAQEETEEAAEESADGNLLQSNDHNIAHLSDAGSDDGVATCKEQLGASSAMIRGGETLGSTVDPGVPTALQPLQWNSAAHVARAHHLCQGAKLSSVCTAS